MKQRKVAIVIGGGNYNELGLIRSCGETGMKVIFLSTPNKVKPVYKSRYVDDFIEYDGSEDSLLALLTRTVDAYAEDIYLYPATDKAAKYIDSNYSRLSKRLHVPNAHGKIELLMDKEYQCELAVKAGIQTPSFRKVELNGDMVFPSDVSYPCIIKPLQSIAGNKEDISVCNNVEEMKDALKRFLDSGCHKVLIQDYIKGSHQTEIAIPGVATEQGEVLIHGVVRKKRIFGNGSTVCGKYVVTETIPCLDEIKVFIKSTGYVGLFDIEFLENENGLHFIECNFRNGAYGYAVTSAGFNMPAAFAGIKDDRTLQLRNRRFMEERTDVLNPIRGIISWWAWLWDVARTDTFLWTKLNDLAPMKRSQKK
jgi:predicted ATP-grasp superfamily ATP-dependent carboligase